MSNLVLENGLTQGLRGAVDAVGSGAMERSATRSRAGDSLVVRLFVLGWMVVLGWGLFFEVGADSVGGVTISKGGGAAAAGAFFAVSVALFALSFWQQRVPRAVLLGALSLLTLNLGLRSFLETSAFSRPGMVVLTRLEQDGLGAKTRILAKRLLTPKALLADASEEATSASSAALTQTSSDGSPQKPLWVDWSLSPSSEPEARRLLQTHPSLGAVLYGSANRLNLVLPESYVEVPYGNSHLSLMDSASVVTISGRNESEVADFTADLVAAISLGRSGANPEVELAHLKSAYNLPGTWFSPDHQALVALKVGNRLLAQALADSSNPQLINSSQVWFKSASKRIKLGENHELRQAVYYSQALAALLQAKAETNLQPVPREPGSDAQLNSNTDNLRDAEKAKIREVRQRLRYFANGIRNCEQSFKDEIAEAKTGSAVTSDSKKSHKKPRSKRRCFVPRWFFERALANNSALGH